MMCQLFFGFVLRFYIDLAVCIMNIEYFGFRMKSVEN